MSDISFFEKGHIYIHDGERVPCVSDLCRFLHREIYKDAPRWQLDAAADRGTKVHAATELLDAAGAANIEEEYEPYLRAYASFLREHSVQWELTEHSMWHPLYRYAGTIDRYGMVDDIPTLLDIKTTHNVYKALCSATLNLYRWLLTANGRIVDQMMILHLKKDGTYKLHKFNVDDALPMALITLHEAVKKKRRKTKK